MVNPLLARLLYRHYALLSILVGSGLFSFTVGPYYNYDTLIEFQAASSVLKSGMPYLLTGHLINQPPLGYYIDSVFFKAFGLSLNTGTAVVTLFALGSILLIYLIGKEWYGETTGLFAAALFALTPWNVILSRSFLIDAQCLFFSLLFLLIGVYAIKNDSLSLFMLSGIVFGLALLTKYYAIFMLIPIAIFYFSHRQKVLRRLPVMLAFFLPALILLFTWYQIISGEGILTILTHEDLHNSNPPGLTPSPLFVLNFLVQNLGLILIAATAISLIVSFFNRNLFRKSLIVDVICLVTILAIGITDTFLGSALNLKSPVSATIKYNYQLLPFICLLAASIFDKCQILFNEKLKLNHQKLVLGIAFLGVLLVAFSVFLNFYSANSYPRIDYLLFKVGSAGYSFNTYCQSSNLAYAEYLGLAMVAFGLVWAVKDKLPK